MPELPQPQPQPQPQQPQPQHGDRAADLIYDALADRRRGGLWIYPACYDDFHLARRRAHSLSQGFGIPFKVDLFGAAGPAGEVTPTIAVAEPGYYAFTEEDPRPRVVYLPAVRQRQQSQEGTR